MLVRTCFLCQYTSLKGCSHLPLATEARSCVCKASPHCIHLHVVVSHTPPSSITVPQFPHPRCAPCWCCFELIPSFLPCDVRCPVRNRCWLLAVCVHVGSLVQYYSDRVDPILYADRSHARLWWQPRTSGDKVLQDMDFESSTSFFCVNGMSALIQWTAV